MSAYGEGGIFVKDGSPVRFFLHKKLKDGRDRLIADIKKDGGEVVNTPEYADTILIDERKMDLDICRGQFYNNIKHAWMRHVFIEPRNFVSVCLSARRYWHKPPRQLGMDGRPPNRPARTAYTTEDDENLCRYIATRIPDRGAGGRQGNNLYQMLERLATGPGFDDEDESDADEEGNSNNIKTFDKKDFAWVLRHPWQSWRERYRNHADAFDRRIAQIIADHEANYNEEYANPHGMDHRDRRNGPVGRHIKVGAVREDGDGGSERAVRRPSARSASMSRSPQRPMAKKRPRESEWSRASHPKRQRLQEEEEEEEEAEQADERPRKRKKAQNQDEGAVGSDVELPRSAEEARARARAKRKAGYIDITDDEGRPEENVHGRQESEDFPIDVDADLERPESPMGAAHQDVEDENEPLRTQATLVGTSAAPKTRLPAPPRGSPTRPSNSRKRREPVQDDERHSSPRAPSPTLVERPQREQRPLPRPRRAPQVPEPEPENEQEAEAEADGELEVDVEMEAEPQPEPQPEAQPRTTRRTTRRSVSRARSRSRSRSRSQPRVPPTPRMTRARSRSQSQARAAPAQTQTQSTMRVTRARSRSQSQEPQAQAREQALANPTRGRGRGRAGAPAPALEDIRESPSPQKNRRQSPEAKLEADASVDSGSSASRSARAQVSVPPVETLDADDLQAVEAMLQAEVEETQSAEVQEMEDELKQEDVDVDEWEEREREVSTPSDSDDARTHRFLHPHVRSPAPSPSSPQRPRRRESTRPRDWSPLPIPQPLDLDSDDDEDEDSDEELVRDVRGPSFSISDNTARERGEQTSFARLRQGGLRTPQQAMSASASGAAASNAQRRPGKGKVEVVITTSPHGRRSQGKPPSRSNPPSQAQQRVLRSGVNVPARAEPEFPSPGTKAREVRDGMEEALDALPYVPPENTRAARALRSRNV